MALRDYHVVCYVYIVVTLSYRDETTISESH